MYVCSGGYYYGLGVWGLGPISIQGVVTLNSLCSWGSTTLDIYSLSHCQHLHLFSILASYKSPLDWNRWLFSQCLAEVVFKPLTQVSLMPFYVIGFCAFWGVLSCLPHVLLWILLSEWRLVHELAVTLRGLFLAFSLLGSLIKFMAAVLFCLCHGATSFPLMSTKISIVLDMEFCTFCSK